MRVAVALVKVWRAVQALALVRFKPTVRAAEPLYAAEKVREASVAERLAKLPPRETPEMVLFWSWLLPIEEEATTQPLASTERMASFLPESWS